MLKGNNEECMVLGREAWLWSQAGQVQSLSFRLELWEKHYLLQSSLCSSVQWGGYSPYSVVLQCDYHTSGANRRLLYSTPSGLESRRSSFNDVPHSVTQRLAAWTLKTRGIKRRSCLIRIFRGSRGFEGSSVK